MALVCSTDETRRHTFELYVKQELDEGDHVTVKRVGLRDGLKEVLEKGQGMPIEGLYLFALGLNLGLELGGAGSTPKK